MFLFLTVLGKNMVFVFPNATPFHKCRKYTDRRLNYNFNLFHHNKRPSSQLKRRRTCSQTESRDRDLFKNYNRWAHRCVRHAGGAPASRAFLNGTLHARSTWHIGNGNQKVALQMTRPQQCLNSELRVACTIISGTILNREIETHGRPGWR